jgi:DNA-binding NarL/FixJ family response regulator
MLRVVVAEDNYLVREGVRRLLDDGDDVRVVADAASAPELLQRVREHRPDAGAVLTCVTGATPE